MRFIETDCGNDPSPRWDASPVELPRWTPDGGNEARLELLEERLAGLPIFLTLRALLLDGSSQISGDVDETWREVSGLSVPGTMDEDISLICGMLFALSRYELNLAKCRTLRIVLQIKEGSKSRKQS